MIKAYKCRSLVGAKSANLVHQILSGHYTIDAEYLPDNRRIDSAMGIATLCAKTPIGTIDIKCEYQKDPKPKIIAPGQITITMKPGCLWHPSPIYFDDPHDVNPIFATSINQDHLRMLVNPALKSITQYADENVISKIASSTCREMIGNIRNLGMCSLSLSFHSTKLWRNYGGEGYGIAIEFEIPGIDTDGFYGVKYSRYREEVDINDIIRSALTEDLETQRRVIYGLMCTKTYKWKFEDEVRHITTAADQYAYVAPISRVLFGPKVPSKTKRHYRESYQHIRFVDTDIKGGIVVDRSANSTKMFGERNK